MLAWLCGLCWLSGPFWFIVVTVGLPTGTLFVRGARALWSYVATLQYKGLWVLGFLLAGPVTCTLVCLWGFCGLIYPVVFLAVAVPMLIGKLVGIGDPWLWKSKQRFWVSIVATIILVGLFDGVAIWYLDWERYPDLKDAVRLAMYTERAANLASGVSPILPTLCVFGGIGLAAVCHLRRIRWLCWRPVSSPVSHSKLLELAAIRKQIDELSDTLRHPPVVWFGWLPLLLVASISALLVFACPRETFESAWFKWFVRVSLVTLLGVITVTWFQTLALWGCLRQLLHRLAWHPMASAYFRLPGIVKRKFRAQLFAAIPTDVESELPLQQWQYLKDEVLEIVKTGSASPELVSLRSQMQEPIWIVQDGAAQGALDKLLQADAAVAAHSSKGRLSKDDELGHRECIAYWARTRSLVLSRCLEIWWETRRERNPEPREKKKRSKPPKDPVVREDRLYEKAEEFVAIQLALVVRSVLAHLKNYLATSMAVVMLLLGMLNSYPFQPHRMLLIVGWAIGLFVIGTALWIFVVCNRDEALSRLSGLHPNKIDWDQQFILSVFTYGVVPVLVLLSMQFPEYGKYAYSPLEFVTKVLK
jgi:hypothetical protein